MRRLSLAAVCVLLSLSTVARAEPSSNPYLTQAKVFFQGLRFEKCLRRLEQAARWKDNSKSEVADVEVYQGLCLYSLNRRAEAQEHFELALQIDPAAKLPATASPRIQKLFNEVANEVAVPVRPATPTVPLAQAPSPTAPSSKLSPTLSTPPPSAFTSVTPVAQPSRAGPIVLGAVAVASGGAGAWLGVRAQKDERASNSASTFNEDAPGLRTQARNEALGANIAYAVAGAALVSGVVWLIVAR